jgi:hypothetical protein
MHAKGKNFLEVSLVSFRVLMTLDRNRLVYLSKKEVGMIIALSLSLSLSLIKRGSF